MAISIVDTDRGVRIRLSSRELAVLYVVKPHKYIAWKRQLHIPNNSPQRMLQMTDSKYTLGLI